LTALVKELHLPCYMASTTKWN